jgi:hypothetical protein
MNERSQQDSGSTEPKDFRKKPVVIQAVHFTQDLALHCLNTRTGPFGLTVSGDWHPERGVVWRAWVSIETLEGIMRAEVGDWIIRGVKGELYPCKPDIFEATYDPA